MKHNLPPLDSLKAFEAAARLLSFTRAAEELCVSKGAISYQVKKLEQHLHQPLFRRTTRQIFLTDAGQLLYQQTRDCFQQLQQQFAQLSAAQESQVIIAVTTYTAVRWLSPRLAAYTQAHKKRQIMLQHTINQPDFDATGLDLSIQWQHQQGDSDHFIHAPLFPVASPALINTISPTSLVAGELNHPAWQNITLLTEARREDLWQSWNKQQACHNPRQIIADANVRVQAAIDGQGIILADQLMQAEIDTGALQAISRDSLILAGYAIRAHSPQGQALLPWLLQAK